MGNKIIFARPSWAAGSYRDFWRLVELAGYPIIDMADMDFESDNCYIFSTHDTHWYHGWPDAKCRIIYWDIEHYPDVDLRSVPNVEVWTSDAAYAKCKHIKHVPMGSDVRLAGYENGDGWYYSTKQQQKLYDTTLLSYMTYRRQCIAGDLVRAGVRFAPKQQGYTGQERDMLLRQSRSMTYVHQRDEYQAIAPQRWALAAAYSLPIISETIADAAPFGYSHLLMSSYEHLAEFATMWLTRNDSHILENYGRALHSLLCHEMTFAKVIEANV